jgi:adenylate kinase
MDIALIGAPGSGKGTQAAKLAQTFTIRHISSGDLFRKAFEDKTELGLRAQAYVDLGELVPDDMTVPMILHYVEEPESAQGVVLDGFPRTLTQAQALDEDLQRLGRRIDLAIHFAIPHEALPKRLSGRLFCHDAQHVYHSIFAPPRVDGICDIDGSTLYQRSDDEGESARKRLVIFYREAPQLLDYYRQQNNLKEINADQSIDQVYKSLVEGINEWMKSAGKVW